MADLQVRMRGLLKKAKGMINGWNEQVKELKEQRKAKRKVPAKEGKLKKQERVKVDVSASSVARAALVVAAVVVLVLFVYEIRSVMYLFLISLFFAAAFNPFVDKMERWRVPRWVGILLIYVVALSVFVLLVTMFVPLIVEQLTQIAGSLKDLVMGLVEGDSYLPFKDKIEPYLKDFVESIDISQVQTYLENAANSLASVAGNGFELLGAVFSNLMNFFVVLVLTFFMVVERSALGEFFHSLLPSRYGGYAASKAGMVQDKIGAWLRGQVMVCLLIGFLVYVGLALLGVEYALTLGMFAAVAELIPYLGPVMAGVPAVLIAFNQDPWLALWALVFYVMIQAIEGNIMVPIIMEKAVGLSPIVIILAMMIGFQFFGIVGMVIAVPLATALKLFVQDYTEMEK